jgi:hypothetical protein
MPLIFFVGSVFVCLGLILLKKFIDSRCYTNQVIIEPIPPVLNNEVPPKYEEIIIEPPPRY